MCALKSGRARCVHATQKTVATPPLIFQPKLSQVSNVEKLYKAKCDNLKASLLMIYSQEIEHNTKRFILDFPTFSNSIPSKTF